MRSGTAGHSITTQEGGYLLYESNAFRLMERIDDTIIFSRLNQRSGYFIIKENRKKKLISYTHSRGYGSFPDGDLFYRIEMESKDEISEFAQTFNVMTTQLDNLIQSLLSYSRAGSFEFSFKNTDIGEIVGEPVDSLSLFLKENNAEVVIADKLPTVKCDPVRTGEIFYNLITNSIKYNERDQKRVEVGYIVQVLYFSLQGEPREQNG